MHPRAFLAIIPLAAALPACSELKTDMKMAGEMKMQMDGNIKMDGAMAMKIEGPIQMTLQGPTITYAGTYVSEKLLEQVQEQRTTGEWVLAVFGEPDERKALSDGSEIWKWHYRPTEESALAFSLFGGDKDKPRTPQMLCFVQIMDGVVVRKFRD